MLNRVGTLGLTGKEARVEDEIYIVNVHLNKSGNLKVLIRIQRDQSNVIIEGGAEAAAGKHEGKGCGNDNFSSSFGQFAKISFSFSCQVKASLHMLDHNCWVHTNTKVSTQHFTSDDGDDKNLSQEAEGDEKAEVVVSF